MWRELPEALRAEFDRQRQANTAIALAQSQLAKEASLALEAAGIRHAFVKGIHLRYSIYQHPSHRPSDDIDLVVAAADQNQAIAALQGAGFTRHRKANETHETTLHKGGSTVDLHWRMFRPGRSRQDFVPRLLESRLVERGLPVCDDLHTSLLLTVGPAIGDYVTARLIRAVDLDRWIRAGRAPWQPFVQVVHQAGLGVAAWAMLTWTRSLLFTPVPDVHLRRLQPSRLGAAYLRGWIALDPAWVYHRWPLLARAGFSLALHDSWRDLPRALLGKALGSVRSG